MFSKSRNFGIKLVKTFGAGFDSSLPTPTLQPLFRSRSYLVQTFVIVAELTYDMCYEVDEDPAVLHITDTASTVSEDLIMDCCLYVHIYKAVEKGTKPKMLVKF